MIDFNRAPLQFDDSVNFPWPLPRAAALDPVEAFRQVMVADGLEPGNITPDGTLYRFHVEGDRARTENGWYVLHLDPPAGSYGCWKRDIRRTWSGREYQTLTPEEKARQTANTEAMKRQREEAEAIRHEEARREAVRRLPTLQPAPSDHPYLVRKEILPHDALLDHHGNLIVTMHDIGGTLRGWETIAPDGTKRRLTGTNPKGAFHVLGDPATGPGIMICEGYATGASIHEATGMPVICAFSSNNLLEVARAWCGRLPDARITICGDNDAHGKGQEAARAAADAIGGRVVISPMVDTDFNDLATAKGPEAVRRVLEGASEEESPRDRLKKLAVQREYIAMIGNEAWIFQNLIIKNQILLVIAKSGGGKTTISYGYLAPWIIEHTALSVYYFDLDSPASDHARMHRQAEEIGPRFQWINPLTHGKGPEEITEILKNIIETGTRLDDSVLFFDTLKKFIDMLDKKSVKPFFSLMRQLTALGSTVVLLGHANKHRDTAGSLVFEGVGDVMSDTDALIFLERISSPGGGQDIITVVDPDKGAKVRGLYEPISFHIAPDRTVTINKDVVSVPDWTPGGAKRRKLTDEEIQEMIQDFLRDISEPVSQTIILDRLKGKPGTGINRTRQVLNACCVPQNEATQTGQIFCVENGQFNKKLYGVIR